jgi:Dynamitin
LKAAPSLASSGSGGATSSDSKNIIYELNYNPQKVKLETASKLSDLQKRLDKLEQILGANQEKMVELLNVNSYFKI